MGVTEKETLYDKHDFGDINIPAPQQKEDGKIEMPNLTAEDIFKQILLHNEDGYAADCIIATVERIHGLLQKGTENIVEDDVELVAQVQPEFCKVEMYALTDDVWTVSLIFDSKNDAYLTDLVIALDKYREMVMNERRKSIEKEGYVPEAIPVFKISFFPYSLGALGVGTFSDPIDYYRTLEDGDKEDDNKCGLHLLFANDTMNFEQVSATEDEIADIQADVIREESEKQNFEYRSGF